MIKTLRKKKSTTPRKPKPPTQKTWAMTLFENVGKERIPDIHRALTKVLHPDNQATGDHFLQQQLNDARDALLRG
jgi:hypothetical protein